MNAATALVREGDERDAPGVAAVHGAATHGLPPAHPDRNNRSDEPGGGHSRARLWVLEGNESARRFYVHHGWKIAEERRRSDTIDAAIVSKIAYERAL